MKGVTPDNFDTRVVVLGAGLAGLRGALTLLENGFHVELLERLGELGGMARSLERKGYVFDHGPHGFFSLDKEILNEFEDLVGRHGGYRWVTKWSQIHFRNHYFNYPLRLADLASQLNFWHLLQALGSFIAARVRLFFTRRKPANSEEYLVDQFGWALYEMFFRRYTEKVWAVPPKELDVDFMRDRVPSLHLWDVIRKLFGESNSLPNRLTPSGRIPMHDTYNFYYPKKGAYALPRAYAEKIQFLGGTFRFNAQITRIELQGRVVIGHTGGVNWRIPFDYILSTIPLNSLVSLMYPPPPLDVIRAASSLRNRAVLLICLCVNKPNVIKPLWIYYTNCFFNRISEIKHFSSAIVPAGKTGLCVEVGCQEGDDLWNSDDKVVVDRAVADLKTLGLLDTGDIEDFLIVREPHAYPVYSVGYKERVARIVNWIEGTGLMMTAGRQGRFLYINQDAAIRSGYEAAAGILQLHAGVTGARIDTAGQRPKRKIVQ
ncbi:MAG: FAD-dependent oxidoreductase [Acidobacteria bacterium]|nr:FAD-dependent oxidoreductase [Acidobacteriota bacterium]